MEGLSGLNEQYRYSHNSVSAYSDYSMVGGNFQFPVYVPENQIVNSSLSSGSAEEDDYSDSVLRFINQVLMDDDFDDKACTIQDSALRVAEKSLYNVLCNRQPQSPNLSAIPPPLTAYHAQNPCFNYNEMENLVSSQFLGKKVLPRGNCGFSGGDANGWVKKRVEMEEKERDEEEERRKKQVATFYPDEAVLMEMFQKMLQFNREEKEESDLNSNSCRGGSSNGATWEAHQNEKAKATNGEAKIKKKVTKREAIDMRSLLIQCMQAISSGDQKDVDKLMNQIKQRSSPTGDASQRLANCFVKALEARFAGTGSQIYRELLAKNRSNCEALKAYTLYVSEFPFLKASNYFTTKTILDLAQNATTVHVVHFGIMHGLQIPPIVQALSKRPGGTPKLRVTGIDYLCPGFRPSATVEETGRRIAKYCESYNVPFEFVAIAQNWEAISPEDLKIEKDEVLIVTCLYQLHFLLDDTILENSPRDAVLSLIRRIKPDLFIHGVANAAYGSPFFATRFREALFYFSALFDMFEATAPRENPERLLYETEIMGREILNAVACEGLERVERPETYKQWQVRTMRAGFKQVPLNREIVKRVKAQVESGFHKHFFVDEASQWMLQGWKGRAIFALSCWKPA